MTARPDSAWRRAAKTWHAHAGPDRHAMICDTCGATWAGEHSIGAEECCGATRCDDCAGGPHDARPYAPSSWDALYDCRGIRCLPVT